MTHNQIAYANLIENRRHNKVVESETHRSNVANETEANRHNVSVENEANRHNVATEEETKRHNLINEAQGWAQIEETKRSNLARERLSSLTLDETIRHNLVVEETNTVNALENVRHNKATEAQGYASITVAQSSMLEAIRHNQAVETENKRHNVRNENITANQVSNNYQIQQDQLEWEKNPLNSKNRQATTAASNAMVNWFDADTRRAAQEETKRNNEYNNALDTSQEVNRWTNTAINGFKTFIPSLKVGTTN